MAAPKKLTPQAAAAKRARRKPAVPKWYGPFLGGLAQGHTVVFSAREAGVAHQTAYQARKTDPAFAEAWEVAIEAGVQEWEEELHSRVMVGVEKPIYDRTGKLINTVFEKSDTLLMFGLKAKRPAVYRENAALDISGTVAHEISVLGGRQPIEVSAEKRREAARALLAENP